MLAKTRSKRFQARNVEGVINRGAGKQSTRLGFFFLVCNGTKCDTRNEVRYHYSASFIVRNVKGYSSFLSGNFFFSWARVWFTLFVSKRQLAA